MKKKSNRGRVGFDNIVHPFTVHRRVNTMTRKDLGRILGISGQMVGMIENWRANPSPKLAKRAESILGIKKEVLVWPEEYLLTGTD